jgi:hypothetical protein
MKRFLIVIVLLAFCVAGLLGLGLYEKWISFRSDSINGQGHIILTVDKDKMQEDEKKAVDEIKGVGQQVKDKVSGTTEKSKD